MQNEKISELIDKVMWEAYEDAKNSNYIMGGLESSKRIEILNFFLLPYFIKNQEFEICEELNNQIDLIKNL